MQKFIINLCYQIKSTNFEIENIIEMTKPNEKSCFLDIGSGTGEISGKLTKKGYQVYALDSSQAMVKYVEKNHPNVQIKCGDAKHTISYEKVLFSHILTTGFSIYLFENKDEYFRNCFFWLKPGGYLIIHLVDRDKFDPIIPGGKPPLLKNPQKNILLRVLRILLLISLISNIKEIIIFPNVIKMKFH